jgi:hypothetical protein
VLAHSAGVEAGEDGPDAAVNGGTALSRRGLTVRQQAQQKAPWHPL